MSIKWILLRSLRGALLGKFQKPAPKRFLRSFRFWLAALTLIIIILKFAIISYPWPSASPQECIYPPIKSECGFVFDEAHYVPAVRRMLMGEGGVNKEHPPLAKLLIMLGIKLFGDNPIGWRFFITLSGALSIYLLGLIAYELTKDGRIAFFAASLFAFDITSFNLGSIAILDPPTLMFSLLGVLLYLKRRPFPAGIAFGLALLSKLTAAFILAAMLFFEFSLSVFYIQDDFRSALRRWIRMVERMGFTAFFLFIIGLGIYDYYYGIYSTPFEHLSYMLSYHGGMLTYKPGEEIAFPLSWTNPLHQFPKRVYSMVCVIIDGKTYPVIAYYGLQTPLWWMTWIVMGFSAYSFASNLEKGRLSLPDLFTFSWLTFNYLVYFPVAHLLKRYVYPFYFYMAVPAIAVGLSKMLRGDFSSEAVLYAVLGMQLAWFAIFFPVKAIWFLQLLESVGISP